MKRVLEDCLINLHSVSRIEWKGSESMIFHFADAKTPDLEVETCRSFQELVQEMTHHIDLPILHIEGVDGDGHILFPRHSTLTRIFLEKDGKTKMMWMKFVGGEVFQCQLPDSSANDVEDMVACIYERGENPCKKLKK